MSSARTLLLAAGLTASFGVACNKSKPIETDAPKPATASNPADAGDATVPASVDPSKLIHVEGSFEAIDDMFAAVKEITIRLDPEDGGSDPMADFQAQLLQSGFAPGFLNNIDLAGLHAFSMAYPAQGGASTSPNSMSMAATVAVIDGRKVIESTPQSFRPQPLGDGVWEIRQDQSRFLFKEAGKELLVGMSTEDLTTAGSLREKTGKGRRFRVRFWNIPTDNLDPVTLLGLPRDSKLAKDLGKVVQKLQAIALELELGAERDIELVANAEAPFSLLGLDPIGEPRVASTKVEAVLPPDPIMVGTLAWGKPDLVHTMMDKFVPIDRVPAPFDAIARQAMQGVHGLLDQIGNDVVFAVYMDNKGEAALVIAADVKEDGGTRDKMRALNEAIVKAIEAQRTAFGSDKAAQFAVDYKVDGVALAGGKGDRLVITLPKEMEGDLDLGQAAPFMKKNKIEAVSFARNGIAVVTIGLGGRKVASEVAKNLGKAPKKSLAQDEGLQRLRETMGGCQICVSGDVEKYLDMRLQMVKASAADKKVVAQATSLRSKVAKGSDMGDPGIGLRVRPDDGAFAVVVPASLAFAPVDEWSTLQAAFEFVADPEAMAAESGGAKPPAAQSGARKKENPKAPKK